MNHESNMKEKVMLKGKQKTLSMLFPSNEDFWDDFSYAAL